MTDLLKLIESRKSVRKYSDKHISDEDLKKILEAGRLAPSWMNVQSWPGHTGEDRKMISECGRMYWMPAPRLWECCYCYAPCLRRSLRWTNWEKMQISVHYIRLLPVAAVCWPQYTEQMRRMRPDVLESMRSIGCLTGS